MYTVQHLFILLNYGFFVLLYGITRCYKGHLRSCKLHQEGVADTKQFFKTFCTVPLDINALDSTMPKRYNTITEEGGVLDH